MEYLTLEVRDQVGCGDDRPAPGQRHEPPDVRGIPRDVWWLWRPVGALYTAERLTAEELHAHGAVAEVVEPDRLDAAATAQIAAKSPPAVRLAKASFNRIEPMALKEAYRTEQDYTMRLRAFAESADYMAAFFERGSDG